MQKPFQPALLFQLLHNFPQSTYASFIHGCFTACHPSVIQECTFVQIVDTPLIWITIAQTGPSSPTLGTITLTSTFHYNSFTSHSYRPASHTIQLNFAQAKALHDVFSCDNYRAWQRSAPHEWHDSFFKSHVPLIIASCYGQDEELAFTPRSAEQLQERM